MTAHSGPFLQSALFCDRILQEHDGTISVIRIIDTLYVDIKRVAPDSLVSIPVEIQCLISLKAGSYRGAAVIEIVREDPPDYHHGDPWTHTIEFTGAMSTLGVNMIATLQFPVRESRDEWFSVLVNGECVTRMPLQVTLEMPRTE